MVNNHGKRYRLEIQRWGKDWQDKSYFKIDVTECDTIDEVNEYVAMTEEIYEDIKSPDENAKFKFRKKVPKYSNYSEKDWVYDDTHFFWGYAVIDYEEQKIIKEGGAGFENFEHPTKSLKLLDIYFRGDDEIPKNYTWQTGEYEGWLQYRWGDGQNAIELVDERRAKAEATKLRKAELKKQQVVEEEEASEEDIAEYVINTEYDDIQDMYDDIADKEQSKYMMEKYGW